MQNIKKIGCKRGALYGKKEFNCQLVLHKAIKRLQTPRTLEIFPETAKMGKIKITKWHV